MPAARGIGLDRFRGHGLVVNLWATWCVPCVTEMPALDALSRTLAPSGALVLTVSLDRGGADAVRPFFAAHGIRSLPVLLDPHSASLAALGLDGIPITLLIDKAGAGGRTSARSGGLDHAAGRGVGCAAGRLKEGQGFCPWTPPKAGLWKPILKCAARRL